VSTTCAPYCAGKHYVNEVVPGGGEPGKHGRKIITVMKVLPLLNSAAPVAAQDKYRAYEAEALADYFMDDFGMGSVAAPQWKRLRVS